MNFKNLKIANKSNQIREYEEFQAANKIYDLVGNPHEIVQKLTFFSEKSILSQQENEELSCLLKFLYYSIDHNENDFESNFLRDVNRLFIMIFIINENENILELLSLLLSNTSAILEEVYMCDFCNDMFVEKLIPLLENQNKKLQYYLNFLVKNLIHNPDFFKMINTGYWIRLAKRTEYPFVFADIILIISMDAVADIPINEIPELIKKALFCVVDQKDKFVVVPSAIAISNIIIYYIETKNLLVLNRILMIIEPLFRQIYDLIGQQSFSNGIFPMIGAIIQLDFSIGFDFKKDFCVVPKDNKMFSFISNEMFNTIINILSNFHDYPFDYLENLLKLLTDIAEKYLEMPIKITNTLLDMCDSSPFSFKCNFIVYVSIIIRTIDFRNFHGLKFFDILIELILVPAFDIIVELLECISFMLSENNGNMCDHLINFANNCTIEEFQNALDEIARNSDDEETKDLVDEIQFIIQKQLPRNYEKMYFDD